MTSSPRGVKVAARSPSGICPDGQRDWITVRDGVEAKLCQGPDGAETFLLVRSAERREKERAMHARFADRIEEGLRSLQRRMRTDGWEIERSHRSRRPTRGLGRNARET